VLALTVTSGICGATLLVCIYRVFLPAHGVRGKLAFWLSVGGAASAAPVLLLSNYILDSLGWTTLAARSGVVIALTASIGVIAPLEQSALAVVVWPAYRAHRLEGSGTAISAGALAAAGFGVVDCLVVMATANNVWTLVSVAAAFVSRAFAAGLWSSVLSTSRSGHRHWFPVAWLLGAVLDGFMRHLQDGRGPLWRLAACPLLVGMVLFAVLAAKKLSLARESVVFARPTLRGILADPPGIGSMRAAWQHANRPALLHWIVGGAFVCFGANIVGFGLGIGVAHLVRIDLSRVSETDVGAMIPLVVVGIFVLLSYPVAGYLTAKASDADSVFEPGVAALISICAVTILLSLTSPVTIVLCLAIAPIAFALSCLGAWLGLERRPHRNPSFE
jgi:hypothetical protein